jgi:hypothetical protein
MINSDSTLNDRAGRHGRRAGDGLLDGWPRAQGRAARLRVGTRASGMGGVRATACWMAESSRASCKVARGHTRERNGRGVGNGLLDGRELKGELQGCA